MKKSPFMTVPVEPLVKPVAASKLVKFSVVPDANFAILVIDAPASVAVKVVAAVPVACAVVRVMLPATREPRAVPAVPTVALWPLIDAAESVATFESRVRVIV